jgi:hypothetical protein
VDGWMPFKMYFYLTLKGYGSCLYTSFCVATTMWVFIEKERMKEREREREREREKEGREK